MVAGTMTLTVVPVFTPKVPLCPCGRPGDALARPGRCPWHVGR